MSDDIDDGALPACDSLAELAAHVSGGDTPLYVRYSEGPASDGAEQSIDTESGLELPGLSVNPLTPESWWTRPLEEWLARQLCQYRHLKEKFPARFAWVLTGEIAARGPDCEPLIADPVAICRITAQAETEAEALYERAFDKGQGPGD